MAWCVFSPLGRFNLVYAGRFNLVYAGRFNLVYAYHGLLGLLFYMWSLTWAQSLVRAVGRKGCQAQSLVRAVGRKGCQAPTLVRAVGRKGCQAPTSLHRRWPGGTGTLPPPGATRLAWRGLWVRRATLGPLSYTPPCWQLLQRCSLGLVPCYFSLGLVPCYVRLGLVPCYVSLGLVPCYFSLGLVPCYVRLGLVPCYVSLGLVPCYFSLVLVTSARNIDCSLTWLPNTRCWCLQTAGIEAPFSDGSADRFWLYVRSSLFCQLFVEECYAVNFGPLEKRIILNEQDVSACLHGYCSLHGHSLHGYYSLHAQYSLHGYYSLI